MEWSAPEYSHKERSMDWLWTIGLVALAGAVVAIWFHNFIFAIFILISGACLIMFTLRTPEEITFTVNNEGVSISREKHLWKDMKGFHIKKGEPYNKLLLLTSKRFLPLYTIPVPIELSPELRESLLKIIPDVPLEESHSVLFMEKIGF